MSNHGELLVHAATTLHRIAMAMTARELSPTMRPHFYKEELTDAEVKEAALAMFTRIALALEESHATASSGSGSSSEGK